MNVWASQQVFPTLLKKRFLEQDENFQTNEALWNISLSLVSISIKCELKILTPKGHLCVCRKEKESSLVQEAIYVMFFLLYQKTD
jgi:hypothetical protein